LAKICGISNEVIDKASVLMRTIVPTPNEKAYAALSAPRTLLFVFLVESGKNNLPRRLKICCNSETLSGKTCQRLMKICFCSYVMTEGAGSNMRMVGMMNPPIMEKRMLIVSDTSVTIFEVTGLSVGEVERCNVRTMGTMIAKERFWRRRPQTTTLSQD
jgi:hypothetical protein